MNIRLIPTILALSLGVALPAAAQSKGDLAVGIGAHQVVPKSDNGSLAAGTLDVDVGNSVRPTLTLEYFVAENLGVEVIAAWPFEHDISIDGLG